MLPVVTLLICLGVCGATTRLTRIVVEDRIGAGLRRRVITRFGGEHWAAFLVLCPWCISPYIATVVAIPAIFWGADDLPWHVRIVLTALLIPTASHVAGLFYARKE